jgi:very-short-patch-repair endonuclease
MVTRFGSELGELAASQHGHVTRTQLLSAGVPASTIRNWLAAGRLIHVFHGVYALAYRRADPLSRAQAALLATGDRSALAGETASALWDVGQRWPAVPQTIGRTHRRPTGIKYVRSKTLLRRDVTMISGLRVTSAARTVLDVAPLLSDKRLERAINGLRVRRVISTQQLDDVVSRNPKHPGASILKWQLGRAQKEPSRSELELVFVDLLRRSHLPMPLINTHIGRFRVDAYFPEHRLIVELDGWTTHQTKAAFEHDRRQDVEIFERTGIPTVRFTYDQTLLSAAKTARQLKSILSARARLVTEL